MRLWPFKRRTPADLSLEGCMAFLRAGGALTLGSWLRFDAETRAAWEEAGIKVAAERAILLATALAGPEGAQQIASLIDGGAEAEANGIAMALDRALGGRKGAT